MNHWLPNYLEQQAYQYRLEKARSKSASSVPIWTPQPGKQTIAYYSEADELFYGGAGGGGKTDLMLGLAGTQHRHSVVFRRIFPETRQMIERSREIFNAQNDPHAKDSYNESLHIWRLASGRVIEFGAIQYEKDKENQRGRPRDLYCFDELPEFTESQYRFVTAWNRTTLPGQRCRIVSGGNPPTDEEGVWVINYWGAWLDPEHPNPAQPGELRWYARLNDKDVEVANGEPFEHEVNGKVEIIQPRSRTFIPARLEDNPILEATGYRAVLQNLQEPLRSQMLYGDFSIKAKSSKWQIIPTEWVKAAQARWEAMEKPGVAMRAMGVDVAHGGDDWTVISRLYGTYFDDLLRYPGEDTPRGQDVVKYVTDAHEDDAPVLIDAVAYGSSASDQLEDINTLTVIPINNGAAALDMNDRPLTDKSGKFRFSNIRAASYWLMREALDPASGENIALPPDRRLRIDLCTPLYRIVNGRIRVEEKEEIVKRIGHSPDDGDAVVLNWYVTSGVGNEQREAEFDTAPTALTDWRG